MEVERRAFEMSRVLGLLESAGWEELSRRVEQEKMFVVAKKSVADMSVAERRLVVEETERLATVFGWTVFSSSIDADVAVVTLTKEMPSEE